MEISSCLRRDRGLFSREAVTIAFLIAAFGCGCTGLCYAEMANLAPGTGSSYSFVYHSAGRWVANQREASSRV